MSGRPESRILTSISPALLVDTIPHERKPATESGLFIPNSGVAKNKTMPPLIKINVKEVCMDFVCVGLACSASYGNCTRAHVTKPSDFTTDDIHKIAKHFIDNDIGKFNHVPFHTITLPEELKLVISGWLYCFTFDGRSIGFSICSVMNHVITSDDGFRAIFPIA